ncbi:MAG TPA: GntR family transcriptional regulator, partial [Burkholderiales bacterium]|nr:GntR family transcriptional regulator [Burkholderiales bacterium]
MVTPPASRSRAAAPAIPLLTDRAYERIKHDIITCAIAPGTEISEPQLCTHYRLGKAPVRMALIRLAHDGLLRAIPRRGYMVTPITLKDIQDVFELRLMLEPAAARMAAGKVDAQRLRVLDEACRHGYQSTDIKSITRFLEANKALHVAIAQATGNCRLAAMVAQLLDQMMRLLHLGLGLRNRSQEMQHEHRALVKALSRGDGETAERISREQIEAARSMVLS